MESKIPLLVICGPTASGKSGLAMRIAREIKAAEIVSADSMQIYRGMDIGTAKPTKEEQNEVTHHLIDIVNLGEEFSAAQYKALADKVIKEIHEAGRLPVLAGGTGLYIDTVLDNITFPEIKSDSAFRHELELIASQKGNRYLHGMLEEMDPELAERLHENNLGRIIRAIEVFRLTGKKMSQWQEESKGEPKYDYRIIGLNYRDREKLYSKINARVDEMVSEGLVKEAEKLRSGFSKTSLQAIGYKQLIPYFEGHISLEEAVENIKKETRNYAKRQLTWFSKNKNISWFYIDDFKTTEELYNFILTSKVLEDIICKDIQD